MHFSVSGIQHKTDGAAAIWRREQPPCYSGKPSRLCGICTMGGDPAHDPDPAQPPQPLPYELTSLPLRSAGTLHRNQRLSPLQRGDLDLLPMEMTTSGVRCASVVFKRSSQAYGAEKPLVLTTPAHGLSSRFSSSLALGGMYRRQGLETSIQRERVVEGSKDWLMKII
ncbi:hypothetical protein, conserved [Eimeria brunetti]|uniref:Uncharacterized protein n=1 Tax=Eimeria brunetti TaxID=51314 RepID=U6LMK5_9EIME|nr:hypothetical protein, conserved [Eimeria brunetti]